jgi:hypothetical protein
VAHFPVTSTKEGPNEQIKSEIHAHLFFYYSKGIVHEESVPPGQTVNQTFYLRVLERLRNRVVRVRREIANTWFLHHDNAPNHTFAVREFLAQHNITTLSHTPYSPDLAPCDFILFPKLKIHLKGHHFGTDENVQAAATRALNNISSEDFLHCYEEWQQRWNRCIRSQGAYFEGD